MFHYVFKNNTITVTIYNEQFFTKNETLNIIKENHDTF